MDEPTGETGPRGRATWTDEDVELLRRAVDDARQSGRALGVAFEQVARQRGTKPSAVQAKYYALMGPGGRRRRARSLRPVDFGAGEGHEERGRDGSNGGDLLPDVRSLTTPELARVVREATEELERRMIDLESSIRRMFG